MSWAAIVHIVITNLDVGFLSITSGKYQGQELLAYKSDISIVCGTTEFERDCSPTVDKNVPTVVLTVIIIIIKSTDIIGATHLQWPQIKSLQMQMKQLQTA